MIDWHCMFQVTARATSALKSSLLHPVRDQSRPEQCLASITLAGSPFLTGPIRSNCSQFHSQWVASFPVVLDRMIVATTAIKIAPTTEDGSISHVQPQVLPHVTLAALPATVDKEQRKSAVRVKTFGFYLLSPLHYYPLTTVWAKVCDLIYLLIQNAEHPEILQFAPCLEFTQGTHTQGWAPLRKSHFGDRRGRWSACTLERYSKFQYCAHHGGMRTSFWSWCREKACLETRRTSPSQACTSCFREAESAVRMASTALAI